MYSVIIFDQIFRKTLTDTKGSSVGAVRVYFVARTLAEGKGWVDESVLDDEFKVDKQVWRKYRKWKKDALDLHWIAEGKGRIYHIGLAKLCMEIGCRDIGHQIELSFEDFVSRRVRAYVLAGTHTQFNTPISRRVLKEITNIPVSTQRRYDNWTGVERHRNDVVLAPSPANVIGSPVQERKELPQSKNHYYYNNRGELCQRLPDSREVPSHVARPKHFGARRKITHLLRHQNGSYSSPAEAKPCEAKRVRLFFDSPEQFAVHRQLKKVMESGKEARQSAVFVSLGDGKWKRRMI